ncbi:glycosyltransferase family 2 protein [Algibacter pacificus]|uniref:glycosyltransferase family 2 protein n=1 Tax=Algibacter pacificus TaxID=2599389 RepID=UPI001FE6C08A|nr:glycosyltransferase family 2 protein [Algibacter pacificus]
MPLKEKKKRINDNSLNPLVSVIIPMFNSEAYILDAINSVINQTYKNWELILVDDCSSDNTWHIINPFLKLHPNIKLLKNSDNYGAAVSRNNGIQVSKGDYIAFLDSDDLWKPNKLEKQISFMQNQECDVCFSSYDLINKEGNSINKRIIALKTLTYSKLLKSNYIGNLTGIYNVTNLGKITTVNTRKRQDWLLWLAAIKKSGKPAKGIQESLAYYRIHENSMSANKLGLVKHNYWVYKKGLGFSTIKSIGSMLVFFKEHFLVKTKQKIKINKI